MDLNKVFNKLLSKFELSNLKQNSLIHVLIFIQILGSGLIISGCQLVLFLSVYPFSKYWYRRINYYFCYSFYGQCLFLAEWWAGIEMEVYIDKEDFEKYYGKEQGLCVMNHTYDVDWIMGYMFCNRIHALGNCKSYIKKALFYIPIVGWIWYFGDMMFMERSFEKDKKTIEKQLSEIVDYPSPGMLVLFPEGTRLTPDKYEQSVKFAKEKGLPILKHHLIPRTKGFLTSLPPMRGKVGGFYDITLTFKKDQEYEATVINMAMGRKMKAYCYIERIPFENIPVDEKEAAQFLQDLFVKKDKLQDSFHNTGDYFKESGIKKSPNLQTMLFAGDPKIFLNFFAWTFIILSKFLQYFFNCLVLGNYIQLSCVITFIIVATIMMGELLNYTQKSHIRKLK